MPRFFSSSWLPDDLTEPNSLVLAGWTYLLLGFSCGAGVLISSGLSLLAGTGMLYDWSTIAWAVIISALSVGGWASVRYHRVIEGQLGALRNNSIHKPTL